ncbi:SDR family oxidoreductase [Pseudofrankia inefficax]|uniref:Short-chain dehydrogenase/reductase SDR n=1 Tax=Pseudofrankia inefficax (strain DSM 45817 / CECT 9037 / DDB 130130 / EuI1c) TaxID=298654 RepID=E3J7S7_PSEI1|nr:SDR family oxidoreductase [Pseudofrankia inefficax]ADP80831.1 short-chain dehydrogenase/reductase SDR [Pseudofrankia inefficax]
MRSRLDLTGRPTLVVGGGGAGIGSAVAAAAAGAGAPVAVITHNADHAEALLRLVRAAGVAVAAAVADVLDEGSLVAAIARLQDELGPIRNLVNVVGGAAGEYHRPSAQPIDSFDRVMERNLRYVPVSCREVGAALLAAGETGSIVNISSGAARGAPLLGAYAAAKAGLEALTRSMALAWGPHGIRVNAVSPGTTRTGDQERGEVAPGIPLRRRGEASEVAAAVLFLLSDLSSYTTGHILPVDGGAALGHPGGEQLSAFAGRDRPAGR